MKEVFILKQLATTFSGSTVTLYFVKGKTYTGQWVRDAIDLALEFPTYSEAQQALTTLVQEGSKYQIEKMFVYAE